MNSLDMSWENRRKALLAWHKAFTPYLPMELIDAMPDKYEKTHYEFIKRNKELNEKKKKEK